MEMMSLDANSRERAQVSDALTARVQGCAIKHKIRCCVGHEVGAVARLERQREIGVYRRNGNVVGGVRVALQLRHQGP